MNTFLAEARTYFLQRQLAWATHAVEQALRYDAHSLVAWWLRGVLLNIKARYEGSHSLAQEAILIFEAAQKIAERSNDTVAQNRLLISEGYAWLNTGNEEKAKWCFQTAFQAADQPQQHLFQQQRLQALIGLSIVAEYENDLTASLQLVNEATQLFESHFATRLVSTESLNDILDTGEKNCDFEHFDSPDELRMEILNRLSQIYVKRQEHNRISEYSIPLLEHSKRMGDVEKEVAALLNLAIVRAVQSDYKTAMQWLLESLEKSQRMGFRSNAANCLINISTIYAHLFNYDAAIERYQNVLTDYKDVLLETILIAIHNNLGNIYYTLEQHDAAIEQYSEALQIAQSANYQEMIAQQNAQLSRVYLAKKEINEAISFADVAHHFAEDLSGRIVGRQINLLNSAEIFLYLNDMAEASKKVKEGIREARKVRDKSSELRGFKVYAAIFEKEKNFLQAYKAQRLYNHIQNEYAKVQRRRQIIDLEIQYSIQEKQQKIEQLTKENQLQGLLLQQSSQISQQNELLVQANAELQQFAYITSHDLKEPLRMIGSFTQIIHKKYHEKSRDELQQYFGYVEDGVVRMSKLLDALLEYATIGKKEIELETVDIPKVLEVVCHANLQLAIAETNTRIIIAPNLPQVQAVQALLVQLFQNLISNAIKFRQSEQQPIIRINMKEDSKNHLFEVADNGIGIEKQHEKRIFVIFQRLHHRNQYEGTGIGLSICQKIVQQLGGKIWVESELGKGATFFFTIPKTRD